MSSKTNEDNIESLRQVIRDSNKIAAFVGAGASYFLGIKSWEEVLREMAKEFGANANIDVKKSIEEKGFAKTATTIYETRNDKRLYLPFLSKQFEPKKGTYYSLHIKIISAFKIILTTNYDGALEEAFRDLNPGKEINIQRLPQLDLTELLSIPTLVYLHGNKEDGVYIFKEDEYRSFYPSNYSEDSKSSRLEHFLRGIFPKFTLVFIGFSFNDKDFVKFFKKVLKEEPIKESKKFKHLYGKPYPIDLPHHFVIISNNELKSTISKGDIRRIFEEQDNSWENLFVNSSDEELRFRNNAENIIDRLNLMDSKKKEILYRFRKCSKNKERIDFFNDLGIKVISFEGNNYNQIESILRRLQKEEVTVGTEEEKAYVR